MSKHSPQLHRLLNPLSGEIKLVSPTEARYLRSYGWRTATLAEWLAYRAAVDNYTALKHATKIVRH